MSILVLFLSFYVFMVQILDFGIFIVYLYYIIYKHDCLNKMQNCVSNIKAWMAQNKLKVNDDKTEVMFI